jgi:hypothetical protein
MRAVYVTPCLVAEVLVDDPIAVVVSIIAGLGERSSALCQAGLAARA